MIRYVDFELEEVGQSMLTIRGEVAYSADPPEPEVNFHGDLHIEAVMVYEVENLDGDRIPLTRGWDNLAEDIARDLLDGPKWDSWADRAWSDFRNGD